jgi:hypothetical protein
MAKAAIALVLALQIRDSPTGSDRAHYCILGLGLVMANDSKQLRPKNTGIIILDKVQEQHAQGIFNPQLGQWRPLLSVKKSICY